MCLEQIKNSIKYILVFMYHKVELVQYKGLRNLFEKSLLEDEYKEVVIIQVNRKINSLSHKYYIHISESIHRVWRFDHLISSGGDV